MERRTDDVEPDNQKLNILEKIFRSPFIFLSMGVCLMPVNCVYIPLLILCIWLLSTSKDEAARYNSKILLFWLIFVFVIWFYLASNTIVD